MQINYGVCDCCNTHRAFGMASVPYVPMTISYCICCIRVGNYPMWLLISNTACIGGLDKSNLDWRDMVETSLAYQGRTLTWFNEEVEEYEAKMYDELEALELQSMEQENANFVRRTQE